MSKQPVQSLGVSWTWKSPPSKTRHILCCYALNLSIALSKASLNYLKSCPKVGDGVIRRRFEVACCRPRRPSPNDFRQSVRAIEVSPFRLRGHHQPEGHGAPGLAARAALGLAGAVTHAGEAAPYRVRGSDVIASACARSAGTS